MSYTFDYQTWPIARIKVVGDLTEEDIKRLLAEFDLFCAQGRRWVMVVDCLEARTMNSTARALLAQWEKDNAQISKATTLWCAFVVDSTLVRGVFTAINWLGGFPHPTNFFATLDAAEQETRQRVKALGLAT